MEGLVTEMTVAIATLPDKSKTGSMGRPVAGYDVELHDDEGNICEPGEEGQIVIRTDGKGLWIF